MPNSYVPIDIPHDRNHVTPRNTSAIHRAALLAAILLLTRWPLLDHPIPVHGDEDEFIAAIDFPQDYPVHHPGYPLWVALGTLLAWFGVPAYSAYQAWSVLASVAAPVILYYALRRALARYQPEMTTMEPNLADGLAWWTAMAFGVCPLVWFTGVTALNYAAACMIGLAVINYGQRAIADSAQEPNGSQASPSLRTAALLLAVSLLLRPDLLLWLGPLVAWAAWRCPLRARILAALIVAGGLAATLLVTAWLYGRAAESQPAPDIRHTIDVILNTSVLRLGLVDGLARSAVKLSAILGWQVGLPLLICLIGVCTAPSTARRSATKPTASAHDRTLLLLWTLPLASFLLLVHMSEAGHTILLIPAIYGFLSVQLHRRLLPARAAKVAAAMALASLLQFTLYPWSAESSGPKRLIDAKLGYLSASGLRQIDRRSRIHSPGDFWGTPVHIAPTDRVDELRGKETE